MKFSVLVDRLARLGLNVPDTVAWRVGPNTATRARYNIIAVEDRFAVASLIFDRSNGTLLLNRHDLPDGTSSGFFTSTDEACDWIWKRVNDLRSVPTPEPPPTDEEIQENYQRQTERVRQARLAHMRSHPDLWEDYFREHPDQRPSDE